jgi:hypothetical protein
MNLSQHPVQFWFDRSRLTSRHQRSLTDCDSKIDPGDLAMNRFVSRFSTRTKVIALAVAGLTLAAVPAAAGGYHHYYHGGYGYGGAVAAGVVGGLVLGGLAASAAPRYYEPECWIERRQRVNKYGQVYFRDIRVCR